MADKSLDEVMGKIVYIAVEVKKDGEDEKKYSVTAAPTLVLIADPAKEDAKGKKLTSAAPAGLKKELEAALKAKK